MKVIRILLLTLALVAVLAACQPASLAAREPEIRAADKLYTGAGASLDPPAGSTVRLWPGGGRDQPACSASCGGELPSGCTVFTVSKGDRVFFGGNDDYNNPDSFYWVEPPGEQGYGVVWIGTPGNVQQGVNEMGLAYDANGLPEVSVASHPERIPWTGGITSPQMHILHECATVEEVIEWVQTHQWHPVMNDQKQFADASGDAVIISPGPDGELVFTRKPPGDSYLVSSNFNVADPGHGYGYPCARYDTAQAVLGQLLEGDRELTARDAASVLDAVHQEGGSSWTIASLVADLPNGLIYLYYFYQFDEPLVLNVAEELANPRDPGPLSYLFPEDVQQEAARRYRRIQASANRCRWTGMAWVPAVAGCLVLVVALSLGRRRGIAQQRGLIFWVPVVAILGPLGLLVWLAVGRGQRPGGWRAALLEAAGDVTPTVVVGANGRLGLWGEFPLDYPFQNFSDGVIPAAGALGELYANDGWAAGLSHAGEGWKTAFFAFPFTARCSMRFSAGEC